MYGGGGGGEEMEVLVPETTNIETQAIIREGQAESAVYAAVQLTPQYKKGKRGRLRAKWAVGMFRIYSLCTKIKSSFFL